MKKNIFKKLGGAFLGLALGLGVVAGVESAPKETKAASNSYTLVTSADDLKSGDVVVLGCAAKSKAAGVFDAKSTYLTAVDATISNGVLTSANAVEIALGGSAGAWTLTTSEGQITASAAKAFIIDNGNNKTCTISITDNVAHIAFGSTGDIQYNSSSPRFLNYTSSQTSIELYKKSSGGGTTTNYTVTFDVQGHGTAPTAATVASGAKVSEPTAPTASGYTFGGWYEENGCTNKYDFDTAVTSSFTLYAKWTENGGPTPPSPSGSYILVTSLSDLKNGDNVVIATDTPANGVTGVTGFNGTKDATVSTTLNDFVEYTVEVSGSDYYLKDTVADKYIASPGGNEFKYGTKGAIAVDDSGHMMSSSRYLCVNGSYYRFYGSIGSYTPFYLYKIGQLATLKSISTLSGTISAKTGDTSWKIENVSVTGVLSDSASVVDVSKYVDVLVVEAVPEIEQDGTKSVTLKATGKTETTVTKSISVVATLTYINPYAIEGIFEKASGDEIVVDGIYYGTNASGNPLVLDGDYGLLVYGGSATGLTVGDYVTVTGTLNIYNGLYETKNSPAPTIAKLTDASRISKLSTPAKYIVTGNEGIGFESQKVANRLTSLTGVVSSFSSTTIGSRSNVTFTVNSKSVIVTVPASLFTQEAYDKFNASKTNTEEITIEGISTYFFKQSSDPGFEVEFGSFVEKKVDYLAVDFGQDLLDLTDEVCAGYDGFANNKAALDEIWLVLQDADHYLGLAGDEQDAVAAATANASGTVLEQAMARYDYLCEKYGLTNFIGRTITASAHSFIIRNSENSNTAIIAIVVVSLVSVTSLGVLIALKKRKAITK